MLHKFFAVRSSRSLASKLSRRLELEALEDRVPPALVVGGVPHGPYNAGGSFDAAPGSSSIAVPQNSPSFDGLSSAYSMDSGGFDFSSNAYILTLMGTGSATDLSSSSLGQNGATGSGSSSSASAMQVLGQMEQIVGTLAAMTAAQTQNPAQVFNLAVDEVFAAVDAVALTQGNAGGINPPALQSDLTARLASIQNNPVDHTAIGHQLGTAVHNTALFMLANNQGAAT